MLLFYILITTMPAMRHPFWNDFMGDITITKYLGFFCLIYSLFYLARRRTSPSFFHSAQSRWFVVLIILALVSFVILGGPFSWTAPVMPYISFLMLFVVTMVVIDSTKRLKATLLVTIGSAAWAGLYLLREWQKAIPIYGFSYRPGWITGDSNYFTGAALLVIPLALHFVLNGERRSERLYCFGCLIVILAATMIGASRGGFLGLLLSGVLFIARMKRHRTAAFVLLGGLMAVALTVLPSSPVRRLLNPSDGDSASSQYRLELWSAGLAMVKEHPIAGVGLGNFGANKLDYGADNRFHVAHNMYVELAAEMGIPGLLAYLILLGTTLRSLQWTRRRADAARAPLLYIAASGISEGLCGFAVISFFLSASSARMLWLMLFISMALPPLVTKAAQSKSSQRLELASAMDAAAKEGESRAWAPGPGLATGQHI